MRSKEVKAPAAILVDRTLPATARLLWLVCQLPAAKTPVSPQQLQALSGLTRHTILRGLACLESTGWLKDGNLAPPDAALPIDLLLDKRLGVQAKLAYGALQLLPQFKKGAGRFIYTELSTLMGLSLVPVRTAIRELETHRWLTLSQANKFQPIHFTLGNPVLSRQAGEVEAAELRLTEAGYTGEAIMHEFLSLIVDSNEFEENARPGFLVNPYTDELMEFDRYYPPRVAFEFNGPQHYGPTDRYPSKADAWKQEGRDLMKIGICVRRGITLITLHAEDLCLETIRQKVDGLLPLRDLAGHEGLIDLLERAGRDCRRAEDRRRNRSR